jgi:hypothetical protein
LYESHNPGLGPPPAHNKQHTQRIQRHIGYADEKDHKREQGGWNELKHWKDSIHLAD